MTLTSQTARVIRTTHYNLVCNPKRQIPSHIYYDIRLSEYLQDNFITEKVTCFENQHSGQNLMN